MAFSAGCVSGNGSAADNHALVEPLLVDGDVLEVFGHTDTEYCTRDSCLFGADGVSSAFEVRLVDDFDAVVDRFFAVYPDFDVGFAECGDGPDCDATHAVWAYKGEAGVHLDYDESTGSGILSSDAHQVEYSGEGNLDGQPDASPTEASPTVGARYAMGMGNIVNEPNIALPIVVDNAGVPRTNGVST